VASAFSSTYAACLVPGIGTTSEPWCSSQASASWTGVQPDVLRELAHALDEAGRCLEVVGLEARLVAAEVGVGEIVDGGIAAGEKAAPDGAVGDDPDAEITRGSRRSPPPMPRVHSDHSLCSAAIGCTAQAARSVSGLTSLRPR
jgi:hypothetical protein